MKKREMFFMALFLNFNSKVLCESNTEGLGLLWFDKEDLNFLCLFQVKRKNVRVQNSRVSMAAHPFTVRLGHVTSTSPLGFLVFSCIK